MVSDGVVCALETADGVTANVRATASGGSVTALVLVLAMAVDGRVNESVTADDEVASGPARVRRVDLCEKRPSRLFREMYAAKSSLGRTWQQRMKKRMLPFRAMSVWHLGPLGRSLRFPRRIASLQGGSS